MMCGKELFHLQREYIFVPLNYRIREYGIVNQIQRAGVSISPDIAEGCSQHSEKDFARFVEIALGSAFETESLLIFCKEIGYINEDQLNPQVSELQIIQKGLNNLYGKLKTTRKK